MLIRHSMAAYIASMALGEVSEAAERRLASAQTNNMTPEEQAAAKPVFESRQVRRARERRLAKGRLE